MRACSKHIATKLRVGLLLASLAIAPSSKSADLAFLRGLLSQTPAGGWVQANTGLFSDSWATISEGGIPNGQYSSPNSILYAWSSVAWDSARGNLILYGGGHANYKGNEVYLWSGSNGEWSRGSLPSQLTQVASTSEYLVIDGSAPQSAHTYDNNIYLPISDKFMTFGGAVFNTGLEYRSLDPSGGNSIGAGPWLWDPDKANPNAVGGTSGSGYLSSSIGGQMWTNRAGSWIGGGAAGTSSANGTTAYRAESGHDVVYMTRDSNSSGWPSLFRYEVGDLSSGTPDKWDRVGVASAAYSFQSAAAIDSARSLYARIAASATSGSMGLGIWDLSKIDYAHPTNNRDTFVGLVFDDGSSFSTNVDFGIAYDEASGQFYLWDGKDRGTVYLTQPEMNSDGTVKSVWAVRKLLSSTSSQPFGLFANGVLGKWLYVDELEAFIAVDPDTTSNNSGVWLYKPISTPVPELGSLQLLVVGLISVLGLYWRHTKENCGSGQANTNAIHRRSEQC